MPENTGFDVRVTGSEADDMVRALRNDFEHIRTSLIKYGLELTLAGELLANKSGMTERNATDTASRCLAISRLASLLESSGIELPPKSITLEAEWHRERLGSSIVA